MKVLWIIVCIVLNPTLRGIRLSLWHINDIKRLVLGIVRGSIHISHMDYLLSPIELLAIRKLAHLLKYKVGCTPSLLKIGKIRLDAEYCRFINDIFFSIEYELIVIGGQHDIIGLNLLQFFLILNKISIYSIPIKFIKLCILLVKFHISGIPPHNLSDYLIPDIFDLTPINILYRLFGSILRASAYNHISPFRGTLEAQSLDKDIFNNFIYYIYPNIKLKRVCKATKFLHSLPIGSPYIIGHE